MRTLKRILFMANYLLAGIFAIDLLDYYFLNECFLIQDVPNRIYFSWSAFIISLISGFVFLQEQDKRK